MHSKTLPTVAGSLVAAAFAAIASPAHADEDFKFDMVRSPSLAAFPACVPNAHATVRVEPRGAVEEMQVRVEGLPPKTDFDFFVIQVPNGPFGMAWYQGDIETNEHGVGHGKFLGPIHTFHLGLWFNSPQDAVKAGCLGSVTPFNGEHNAGVQVLNTSEFPADAGPLLKVKP